MLKPSAPLTAIIYGDGHAIDAQMRRIATQLQQSGYALAGFVQQDEPRPDRARCDMVLQELSSGVRIGISQDRGPMARGCRLDVGELLRGVELARAALGAAPDLLLINKFGKAEGEGGGFRDLIAEAAMREVPVLVAVPWRNIDGWRIFAGPLGHEVRVEALEATGHDGLLAALGLGLAGSRAEAALGEERAERL